MKKRTGIRSWQKPLKPTKTGSSFGWSDIALNAPVSADRGKHYPPVAANLQVRIAGKPIYLSGDDGWMIPASPTAGLADVYEVTATPTDNVRISATIHQGRHSAHIGVTIIKWPEPESSTTRRQSNFSQPPTSIVGLRLGSKPWKIISDSRSVLEGGALRRRNSLAASQSSALQFCSRPLG